MKQNPFSDFMFYLEIRSLDYKIQNPDFKIENTLSQFKNVTSNQWEGRGEKTSFVQDFFFTAWLVREINRRFLENEHGDLSFFTLFLSLVNTFLLYR